MTIDAIASAAGTKTERSSYLPDSGAAQASGRAAAPTQTVDAVTAKAAVPSQRELEEAVEQINRSVQAKSQSLEFSIDNDSKRTIVKVIDQSTKEVLRQIPTPEALQIAKSLDSGIGLLISQEA
ncbi:flagellar protein FlaG [Massilia endophytica]|uniref:flagellar protein FlaG n=1 Tax=Massilia endophytica TaxID=2899220 RepID=UPI001E2E85CC|nr:flagellar protein FlaG [Massilia endophytica]UGQ45204.1 flagellar protein FlaG [Massilia endophytica]